MRGPRRRRVLVGVAIVGGVAIVIVGCSAFSASPTADQPAAGSDGGADAADASSPTTDTGFPSQGDGSISTDGLTATVDASLFCPPCASKYCGVGGACDPLVFATSDTFTAADLQGLAHADALCMDAAMGEGLPGQFLAWLSVSGTSMNTPNNRFLKSARPYRRIDGQIIADDYFALTHGPLKVPISLNEDGQPAPLLVWTATTSGGDIFPQTCADWTVTTGSGSFGSTGEMFGGKWSLETTPPTQPCMSPLALYCFEQLP